MCRLKLVTACPTSIMCELHCGHDAFKNTQWTTMCHWVTGSITSMNTHSAAYFDCCHKYPADDQVCIIAPSESKQRFRGLSKQVIFYYDKIKPLASWCVQGQSSRQSLEWSELPLAVRPVRNLNHCQPSLSALLFGWMVCECVHFARLCLVTLQWSLFVTFLCVLCLCRNVHYSYSSRNHCHSTGAQQIKVTPTCWSYDPFTNFSSQWGTVDTT